MHTQEPPGTTRGARLATRLAILASLAGCSSDPSWEDVIAGEEASGAVVVEVPISQPPPRALHIEPLATIAPADDASPRQLDGVVSRGIGNTFVTTGTYRPAAFVVHDSIGKLVAVLGNAGSGPGEYRFPDWVVAERDSLFVFDRTNARITVVDSSYQHVRSFPRPALLIRSLAARNGRFLAHSPPPSGVIGSEFKLFTREGRTIIEFGERTDQDLPATRPVTIAPNGALWAAFRNKYVLQQFDTAGAIVRSLIVRRPWFEPWREIRGDLMPGVAALTSDSSGRLWVLIAKPVRGWKRPPARPARDGVHVAATDPNDMDAGYDFVLDVLDPESGRLLGSVELPDGYFKGFIEPGVLYSFRNDEDHIIHVDLWRVELPPQSSVDTKASRTE